MWICIGKANFFTLVNAGTAIQPAVVVVHRRHSRKSETIPHYQHWEFTNIHQKIFIGIDIQIILINLCGRDTVNLGNAGAANGFGDCHFLAERFPAEIIFRKDLQSRAAVYNQQHAVSIVFVADYVLLDFIV